MKETQNIQQNNPETAWYNFALQWADTSVVLGHRLSEWCGHGPILEQDIAMSNIALDLIGEARSLYQYAAELEGAGRSEDDLAYFRDAQDFRNLLLVEQPNGDFAQTILRQFLYEAFHLPWLEAMKASSDATFAAVAEKSYKEAKYHFQWSAEWVIRLGDGTEESQQRIEKAMSLIWPFAGEALIPSDDEQQLIQAGVIPDLESIRTIWQRHITEVYSEATLDIPDFDMWMQVGGKIGRHSEYLGYLLTEMQVLQRAYPGNEW